MDAKITLSFDEKTIKKAKKLALDKNISLSRLTEMIYRKLTSAKFENLEDLPIADWVYEVAEGEMQYKSKPVSRKSMKEEYFSKKK